MKKQSKLNNIKILINIMFNYLTAVDKIHSHRVVEVYTVDKKLGVMDNMDLNLDAFFVPVNHF